jgi:multiple antibiotic resistance protein
MLADTLNLAIMLLILFDPVGSAPIFATMLSGHDDAEAKRTIRHACVTSFWILFVFALGGRYLLQLFGMNLAVFQMAGGLLLLLTSLDIVFEVLPRRKFDPESMSVFPMAYPLIAGPGALAAVMFVTGNYQSLWKLALVSSGALLLALIPTWLLLMHCRKLTQLLGKQGATMVEKLMGVLLTGISLNFMVKGIVSYFGINTP